MNRITALNYFIYIFLVLIIFLLIKSIWKVLPFYSSRFAKFDRKLRQSLDNILTRIYKKQGYNEFEFTRGKLRVKVLAKSRKEAYRKFRNCTTKPTAENRMFNSSKTQQC